jgi:sugar/nucleoside kinase (ribokinase family)
VLVTDDDAPRWPRATGSGPVVALGKLVADQVLVLSEPLVIGGQQRVARTVLPGGAPANVTANLARLGAPARLAGWAGADPLADDLLARLSARAIEVAVVRRGRAPHTTVLVHEDGERTLLADRGDGELCADDLDPRWVADAAVLHLDGFDLLPGRFPAALIAAASLAGAAGVPISVDVAAAARIERVGVVGYLELLAELRPDVLLCNAAEAAVLELSAELPAWAPELVLVHAGASPTRVLTRAGTWSVPVEPLSPERVRDTTGCGDAFAAGVLAGWRAGSPVLDAVRTGHEAAAVVAGVIGAQPPLP